MELSDDKKKQLAKLQHYFIVNSNRSGRESFASQNKIQVQLFIAENNLPYSVEFLLGIEAHKPIRVVEHKSIETPRALPVIVAESNNDEVCCKHCGSPIISESVIRPKGLKPNEKFCSYPCKNKFYKKQPS